MALIVERPGVDAGILVVGAWKDKEHKEIVGNTLKTLHIETP